MGSHVRFLAWLMGSENRPKDGVHMSAGRISGRQGLLAPADLGSLLSRQTDPYRDLAPKKE